MKRRFTEDSWRKEPWFISLCSAIHACKSEGELADLLRDVGTLSELQAWSERLEVARLLAKGLSYRQIATMTGASTTTVTRVANFLENGEGGYRKILKAHRHHRMTKPDMNTIIVHEKQRSQEEAKKSPPPPVTSLQKFLDRKGN